MALAAICVDCGLTDRQIADLLVVHRQPFPRAKQDRRGAHYLTYLERPIGKARAGKQSSKAVEDEWAALDAQLATEERQPEPAAVTGSERTATDKPAPEVGQDAARCTGVHSPDAEHSPASGGELQPEKPKSADGSTDKGPGPTEGKAPSIADGLIAEVNKTGDLSLVYKHIGILAALPDAQLMAAYKALSAALGPKLDPGLFQAAVKKAREALHQHIYREHYGGLGRVKEAKDRTESVIPLTNFTARITANIGEDDGVEVKRFFGIDAQLAYKQYALIVPAGKFATMDWPIEQIGPGAIV